MFVFFRASGRQRQQSNITKWHGKPTTCLRNMMLLRQRGENVYSGGEEPFYPTLRASGCDTNPSVYSFVRFFNAVHSVMESPKVTSGTPNSDIACYQCTRCSIFSFFFSKYLCPQHQQHFKNIVKEMSTKLKGFTLVV